MRRYLIAAAVAAIAALWSVIPAAAASNVLTTGSSSGSAVANNDVLTGNLNSGGSGATFTDTAGNGTVTCTTSSFQATVTGNPTAPATATESLTHHDFSSCSISVFGASVDSVKVDNLPYNASVTSPNSVSIGPGTAGVIQTTVSISSPFLGSFQCVYHVHDSSGKLSGSTDNSNNSLNFSNQQFDLFSGPSSCFASANFSASYAPVTDSSQSGSPAVFTN
jgi:hypothetical protein